MPRGRKVSRRKISLGSLVIILVLALSQHYGWFDPALQSISTNQPGLYTVARFDDGDTIVVQMNGAEETIRFIGVDTPETHDPRKAVQCYGQAASEFTRSLIGNQKVRLEADPLNTNRDRYNRLLRYVYLPDGTLVNAALIQQGYGFAYLSFPVSKDAEFRAYQEEAMREGRGLWSECTPLPNKYGGYTSNDVDQQNL